MVAGSIPDGALNCSNLSSRTMTNGSVYSATEIGTVSLSALVKGDRRARFTGNVIVIMV